MAWVPWATAADDYRNEINGQGTITEIDPYKPSSVIKRRTATGHMAVGDNYLDAGKLYAAQFNADAPAKGCCWTSATRPSAATPPTPLPTKAMC